MSVTHVSRRYSPKLFLYMRAAVSSHLSGAFPHMLSKTDLRNRTRQQQTPKLQYISTVFLKATREFKNTSPPDSSDNQ